MWNVYVFPSFETVGNAVAACGIQLAARGTRLLREAHELHRGREEHRPVVGAIRQLRIGEVEIRRRSRSPATCHPWLRPPVPSAESPDVAAPTVVAATSNATPKTSMNRESICFLRIQDSFRMASETRARAETAGLRKSLNLLNLSICLAGAERYAARQVGTAAAITGVDRETDEALDDLARAPVAVPGETDQPRRLVLEREHAQSSLARTPRGPPRPRDAERARNRDRPRRASAPSDSRRAVSRL